MKLQPLRAGCPSASGSQRQPCVVVLSYPGFVQCRVTQMERAATILLENTTGGGARQIVDTFHVNQEQDVRGQSGRGQQMLEWVHREQLYFPCQPQHESSYHRYNTTQRSRRNDYILVRANETPLAKAEDLGPQDEGHVLNSDREPAVAQLLAQRLPRTETPAGHQELRDPHRACHGNLHMEHRNRGYHPGVQRHHYKERRMNGCTDPKLTKLTKWRPTGLRSNSPNAKCKLRRERERERDRERERRRQSGISGFRSDAIHGLKRGNLGIWE